MPLFLVEGIKRRLGHAATAARSPCSGWPSRRDTDDERDSLAHKLVRLLERELADVAIHDPHVATPTSSFDDAVDAADVVVVATNHPEFCDAGGAARDRASQAARDALVVDPWNCFGAGQVFAYAAEIAARSPRVDLRSEPRPVTGGAGTIGAAVVRRLLRDPAYEVRVSDQREAPAVDARGLRGPHRRPARPSTQRARATAGLLARHPPGGDRRRHRQLPQAAPTR